MVFVPFGEWLPDHPDFMNPGSITATGVVPQTAQSYGPFPSPTTPYAGATLNSACLGSYIFKDASGNPFNFAADKNRLYLLASGDTAFMDVSKATGGPYNAGSSGFDFWSMTAFGSNVIATDFQDNVQSYVVGSSTTFTDLAAAAPRAKYTAAIRDFLFLANVFDDTGSQPQRARWSAIGNPTNWPTPGTTAAIEVQSDQQDLQQVDLGQITGIVGSGLFGADGAVFCERGIYRVAYVGSPAIFDFAVSQGGIGTVAPRSIINYRGLAYYLGLDGFYAYDGSMPSVPIGAQKIDNTFFADLNPGYLATVQGAIHPNRKFIVWAYAGAGSGASGAYNRLLIYEWQLNRWSFIDLTGMEIEWLTRWLSLGYTLDQLDPFATPNGIDSLQYSLDSPFWEGGQVHLSMFGASKHDLQIANGPNVAVILDTLEQQPFPGRRAKVGMARPMGASVATIAIGTRDIVSDDHPPVFGPAVAQNALGWAPQRTTGRYLRARMTLPAGSAFTHLQGIDVEVRPEGRLR